MEYVIIAALAVLVVLAVVSSVKHFKGQGGCCGGGGEIRPARNKLDGPVVTVMTVGIDGMICEHCRNSIERALNGIEGVSARVDLHKKTAKVETDREVNADVIEKAVEKAGYHVTGIEVRKVENK